MIVSDIYTYTIVVVPVLLKWFVSMSDNSSYMVEVLSDRPAYIVLDVPESSTKL